MTKEEIDRSVESLYGNPPQQFPEFLLDLETGQIIDAVTLFGKYCDDPS